MPVDGVGDGLSESHEDHEGSIGLPVMFVHFGGRLRGGASRGGLAVALGVVVPGEDGLALGSIEALWDDAG